MHGERSKQTQTARSTEALQHIKLGITRGLLYLHQDSQLLSIQQDIKAWRLYKRGDNHRKHLYAFMYAVTLMLSTNSEILPDPTKPACASSVTQNVKSASSGVGVLTSASVR